MRANITPAQRDDIDRMADALTDITDNIVLDRSVYDLDLMHLAGICRDLANLADQLRSSSTTP